MATEAGSAGPALSGWLDETLITASPEGLEELEEIVTDVGRSPWLWGHAVAFHAGRPSRRVLYKAPELEIALFGWAAGQETAYHDHGGASGAVFICSGLLVEDTIEAVDGYASAGGPTTAARTRHSASVPTTSTGSGTSPGTASRCRFTPTPRRPGTRSTTS